MKTNKNKSNYIKDLISSSDFLIIKLKGANLVSKIIVFAYLTAVIGIILHFILGMLFIPEKYMENTIIIIGILSPMVSVPLGMILGFYFYERIIIKQK